MKVKFIILSCLWVLFFSVSFAQESTIIELPLTTKSGYGPFNPGFRGMGYYVENDSKNPWVGTYIYAQNIPGDWTEVKQGAIDSNIYQTVYQGQLLGTITQEWYRKLQESWNWAPNPATLSEKPIKTQVLFATGKDASGKELMIIDTNNNLDYSDETAFSLLDFSPGVDDINLVLDRLIEVSFEALLNNEIVTRKVPIAVVKLSSRNMLLMNFVQHATAELDGQQMAVCSTGFNELSYQTTEIALIDETINDGGKVGRDNVITNDNYLTINGKLYKNKGVDTNKNVLRLEEATIQKKQLYATQVGFKAPLFEGEEYTSKEKISLDKYKGKYLLLDFWAIWCGPCLQEMPNLKALYEKTDRSGFEILGIVGDSPADAVVKMIEKYNITWPQVLSDNENKITKSYNIKGYPTVLLLDPEGVIVAKDLRGKALEDKVLELLNK